MNNNESKKIPEPSFNELINNKENEFRNSLLKDDDCSDLIHEIIQKEINNNKTFTGTKIYDKSNENDNSGK